MESYKYVFITIHDNDFYIELGALGKLLIDLINTCGSKILFDKISLREYVLHLFYSISLINRTNVDLNYVDKRLKVLISTDEIKEFHKSYGVNSLNFTNTLINDSDELNEVSDISFNAEGLLIKLIYHNNKFSIEDSNYIVY